MKKLLNVFTLLLFVFAISMTGCGDDEITCDDTALEAEATELATTMSVALVDFSLDASDANCTALKNSVEALKNFMIDNKGCADADEIADVEESINEMNTILADLPC